MQIQWCADNSNKWVDLGGLGGRICPSKSAVAASFTDVAATWMIRKQQMPDGHPCISVDKVLQY
jgi:hypothetical protein